MCLSLIRARSPERPRACSHIFMTHLMVVFSSGKWLFQGISWRWGHIANTLTRKVAQWGGSDLWLEQNCKEIDKQITNLKAVPPFTRISKFLLTLGDAFFLTFSLQRIFKIKILLSHFFVLFSSAVKYNQLFVYPLWTCTSKRIVHKQN